MTVGDKYHGPLEGSQGTRVPVAGHSHTLTPSTTVGGEGGGSHPENGTDGTQPYRMPRPVPGCRPPLRSGCHRRMPWPGLLVKPWSGVISSTDKPMMGE